MYQSVEEAWPIVAREHEGVYRWPYLDHTGKVTVGIGLLIEAAGNQPTEECFHLPWTVDGQPATREQVVAGWQVVNARVDLTGYAAAFEKVSPLRLDDQTINASLIAKTKQFWSELRSQLVDLEEWPADAQLGLIDLAYQLGPHFLGDSWPNFTAGAHASNFTLCSQHCAVKQASPERNAHRQRLFLNAAQVEQLDIDPAVLWDTKPPEEDDMLSDAQIGQIAEKLADLLEPQIEAAVAAKLAALKIPKPPTAAQIATEVLNSVTSDLVKVTGSRGTVRPITALSEIHKAVT